MQCDGCYGLPAVESRTTPWTLWQGSAKGGAHHREDNHAALERARWNQWTSTLFIASIPSTMETLEVFSMCVVRDYRALDRQKASESRVIAVFNCSSKAGEP